MSDVLTSDALIDDLVRMCFDAEPGAMTVLAQGDAQVLLRQAPGVMHEPTTLDGLDAFLRRTVAISLATRDLIRPVRLLTERQAHARGWPCARLANMAIVLAWALVLSNGATVSVSVLLEADEAAEDFGPRFGRDDLPALDDLLDDFYKPVLDDRHVMSGPDETCRDVPFCSGRHVRLGALIEGWFGVDVLAITLRADNYAPRLMSANARAAAFLVWVITESLQLGSAMRSEMIEAARSKTEADARVAGEPGAVAANLVLILACANRHGSGWTPQLLAPRENAASELIEAANQIRSECREAEAGDEARAVALYEMRDHVARHQIHVGRLNVHGVAWRLLSADAVVHPPGVTV